MIYLRNMNRKYLDFQKILQRDTEIPRKFIQNLLSSIDILIYVSVTDIFQNRRWVPKVRLQSMSLQYIF